MNHELCKSKEEWNRGYFRKTVVQNAPQGNEEEK
jgi:hypothetical protein